MRNDFGIDLAFLSIQGDLIMKNKTLIHLAFSLSTIFTLNACLSDSGESTSYAELEGTTSIEGRYRVSENLDQDDFDLDFQLEMYISENTYSYKKHTLDDNHEKYTYGEHNSQLLIHHGDINGSEGEYNCYLEDDRSFEGQIDDHEKMDCIWNVRDSDGRITMLGTGMILVKADGKAGITGESKTIIRDQGEFKKLMSMNILEVSEINEDLEQGQLQLIPLTIDQVDTTEYSTTLGQLYLDQVKAGNVYKSEYYHLLARRVGDFIFLNSLNPNNWVVIEAVDLGYDFPLVPDPNSEE